MQNDLHPSNGRLGSSLKNTLVTFIGACASYKNDGRTAYAPSRCLGGSTERGQALGHSRTQWPQGTGSTAAPAPQPLTAWQGLVPSLFGDGKRLLHLDGATVDDGDILERLVPAVCLCVLHLPHHVLGGAECESETQGQSQLGQSLPGPVLPRAPPPFPLPSLTMPSSTLPNTTCFPSSHGVFTVVMKNWEPLVSLPALAMLTQPGP